VYVFKQVVDYFMYLEPCVLNESHIFNESKMDFYSNIAMPEKVFFAKIHRWKALKTKSLRRMLQAW
jgi:hypothetical protein